MPDLDRAAEALPERDRVERAEAQVGDVAEIIGALGAGLSAPRRLEGDRGTPGIAVVVFRTGPD